MYMRFFIKMKWFLVGTDLEARRIRRWVKIFILLALFSVLFWLVPVEKVVRGILGRPCLSSCGIFLGYYFYIIDCPRIGTFDQATRD